MALVEQVNWDDFRVKAWHFSLMLASAYAATKPSLSWAVPVLTGAAGFSNPPTKNGRNGIAPKA